MWRERDWRPPRHVVGQTCAMSRRIGAIYEALDARNYKLSLKLCNGVLQKEKAPVPLIAALKGVALARLGRDDEALALAREVCGGLETPTDETLVATLVIVFKAVGREDEGVACIERAVELRPECEDLALSLFAAYVRAREPAKAQALALRLFRSFKDGRYVFWAIVTLVMQADARASATAADGGATAAQQLQLAAAMLSRADGQGKVDTEQGRLLQLRVLERQGETEAALALLEKHAAQLRAPEEREREAAALLERAGRWSEAGKRHRAVLTAPGEYSADDWAAHAGLVRCALREEDAHAAVDGVRALHAALQAAHGGLRGPWLASIQLAHTLIAHDGTADHAQLGGLLADYFARFGGKSCFYHDVRSYLSPSLAPSLLPPLLEAHGAAALAATAPELPSLSRFIATCQLRLGCGACDDLDASARRCTAAEWMSVYTRHVSLGADLDPRERGPADPLPFLTAELLLRCPPAVWFHGAGGAPRRHQIGDLSRAALALRLGLGASAHNAQLALALSQACLCLGAPAAALSLYGRCDVKQIQLTSLSHLLVPALVQLGALPQAPRSPHHHHHHPAPSTHRMAPSDARAATRLPLRRRRSRRCGRSQSSTATACATCPTESRRRSATATTAARWR